VEQAFVTDPFLILGIDLDATELATDEAYNYLSRNLNPTNFPAGSAAEEQAQNCMSRIVPAYQLLRQPGGRAQAIADATAERAKPYNPDDFKAFLGHICVAGGIITLDDLNDAISKQGDIDLPLGQILQEKALLSQTELDGLLMGQRLFGAPARPLDPITKRLLALNAVTKDMVKIVLIDQRTNFVSSVPELLLKRGWINPKILQILTDQMAPQATN
jgi:hypothetical protein